MLVKEVMSRTVKTAGLKMPIKEAAGQMIGSRIGSIIVVDNAKAMRGIVTESDILKFVSLGKDVSKGTLADIMTKDVFYVRPNDSVEDAAEIMTSKKVKKLPVIDGNKLVGIITASDIVAFEPKFMEMIGYLLLSNKQQRVYAAG